MFNLDSKLVSALVATIPAGTVNDNVPEKRLQEVDGPNSEEPSLTGTHIVRWIIGSFRYTLPRQEAVALHGRWEKEVVGWQAHGRALLRTGAFLQGPEVRQGRSEGYFVGTCRRRATNMN